MYVILDKNDIRYGGHKTPRSYTTPIGIKEFKEIFHSSTKYLGIPYLISIDYFNIDLLGWQTKKKSRANTLYYKYGKCLGLSLGGHQTLELNFDYSSLKHFHTGIPNIEENNYIKILGTFSFTARELIFFLVELYGSLRIDALFRSSNFPPYLQKLYLKELGYYDYYQKYKLKWL